MEDKKVNYPTQEEIIAFNQKETKRVEERVRYLREQIAAEGRLDGYVLEGLKEELEKIMFPLKTDDDDKWFPSQNTLDE